MDSLLIKFDGFLQEPGVGSSSFTVSRAPHETGAADPELLGGDDAVADAEEKDIHSFEIDPSQVFNLNQRQNFIGPCSALGSKWIKRSFEVII